MKNLLLLFLGLYFMLPAIGQNMVTGKISDEKNEPLPGVTIKIKSTTKGTISDFEGKYSIQASSKDTLVYSMIGMALQTIPIKGQEIINVTLTQEIQNINEVVVIGYGAQKVKDLTAPIVSLKGEELNKQIAANPMQALQGKVAGIQIINTGAPGSGASVKIRGVGSIGDYANPLYIVDGVFVDDINFLSTSDIEDLTVLKDASAAAIYGVRAANGVILVTTKKGKNGKPIVSYDGYYGIQVPVNILPLATKEQYVTMMNEANANATGYIPKDPASYPASTDWYKQLTRTAGITSHSLDISGSTEKSTYSFGGNYFFQEGIMEATNNYQRFNIRGRLDQNVSKFLKIGVNSVISKYDKYLSDNDAFFQAYVNPPVYPVYDPTNTEAYPVQFGAAQKYGFGNQYGNPVATAYYNNNYEKGIKLLFSTYAEFNLIENKLTFKTTYNLDFNYWANQDYTPQFNVGGSQGILKSSLSKTTNTASKQIIDNLLTYKDSKGKHSYSLLLGQSTRMERTDNLTGSAIDVPGYDDQSKYLTNGSFKDRYATDGASVYNGLSFFTRGTYNYNNKYLATATFRADGSTKYQQKWGYFPSFGLGWVLSEENFMKNQKWAQYIKLRVSWGMLGNDNVPANSTGTLGTTGAGSSGIFGDQLIDGVGAQTVFQRYLKWEVVNEFDIGADFTTANYKLTGDIDYYHRVTNNVVFNTPIATGGGEVELLSNNGSVLNSGIEINLHWKDKFSEKVSYQIGFNASTIHNEVKKLEGKDYIAGAYIRGNYTTRTAVRHPIGSFYGYEIDGVYQSEAEALKDPVSQAIKDKGFFKYRDQNGDKVIDDKDKVYLGSSIPWLTGGIDFGLNYQKIDFSIALQGQLGNKILNTKRMNRDIFADGNYDQNFYDNRWTTTNKSSEYPSAEAYNYSYTQQANDFFVENGSYIRIQNVQIGYTTDKIKYISRLRIYISAQRPFTFFTYNGFTPEVGGSPISSGVDNSVYPMQAIYSIGAKLNF
jgi:TonB-linked SusC/RagA family outer membrane protein